MTTLELLVIVYGSCHRDPANDERFGAEQRRVEITLNPTIPSSANTIAKQHQWLQGFLLDIGVDMKHNRNWRCEFCKLHARETVWMMCSWMHLTAPRVVGYVHSVCDGGEGPCYERLREVNAQLGRATGSPPSMIPRIRRGQAKYPLSSSCAVCHNEEDSSRRNLKQCARCELTRYCRCVDFVILSCRTKIFGGAALTVKGRTGADTRHAVKWSRRLNGTGISL
ncbi:hypothetical protein C8J57DRAFT_446510 [Mycena rebaudengoi]|nr:hypothetical protein C8J57DRAFT_64200 [Mycena rebaudengoi]KAJ7263077.1 hypothetical protein C8J57DRAFT_446510 [Mycena rebaudengoi]